MRFLNISKRVQQYYSSYSKITHLLVSQMYNMHILWLDRWFDNTGKIILPSMQTKKQTL